MISAALNPLHNFNIAPAAVPDFAAARLTARGGFRLSSFPSPARRRLPDRAGLIFIPLLLMLGGCNVFSFDKQRPNKPGHAKAELTIYDADTGRMIERKSLAVTNDENPKAPLSAEVNDRIVLGTGGSEPFEWESVTGEPLFWFGFLLTCLGIGVLIADMYPPISPLIPNMAGWYVAGGGVLVMFVPFLGDAIRDNIIPIMVIVGAAGFGYYEMIYRKREKTMKDAEEKLILDDDLRAAGAIHRVRTGDEAAAKLIAKPAEAAK